MSEGTQPDKFKAWPWPDSLDALRAAPNYHRLLFENDRVRVLEVRIPRAILCQYTLVTGLVSPAS